VSSLYLPGLATVVCELTAASCDSDDEITLAYSMHLSAIQGSRKKDLRSITTGCTKDRSYNRLGNRSLDQCPTGGSI